MSSPPEPPETPEEGPPEPPDEVYDNVIPFSRDDFEALSSDEKGWEEAVWAKLDKTKDRTGTIYPKPHSTNIMRIFTQDERWSGRLWWNEFDHRPYKDATPVTDTRETEVAFWLSEKYRMNINTKAISEVIDAVAVRDSRHPVRDYLNGLVWDGTKRAEDMLHKRFSAAPEPAPEEGEEPVALTAAISKRWMISAVARVMVPGDKVDSALILVGAQGTKKSSAFDALAGNCDWFNDSILPIGHKDAYQNLQGVWIYEIAELAGVSRRDQNVVKAFLTGRVDRFRPSYGRRQVKQFRHCVFVGSTNQDTFLTDYTGNRRYWPVKVDGVADRDGIVKDRDQLWAEAVHLYRKGEQWWLTEAEETALLERCRQHEHDDPWEIHIGEWLLGRGEFTIAGLLEGALGIKDRDKQTTAAAMHAADVLQRLGYTKRRVRVPGGQTTFWNKSE